MRYQLVLTALAVLLVFSAGRSVPAADWATAPSFYTHDWSTGQRVAQYAPIGPYYYYHRPDFLKSGYRQIRSTLDLGNSSDNMHLVEQWGADVVPYEAWRFPYRPYSVPYPAWGPPFGGLGGGTGGYPYSGGGGANIWGGGFFPPFGFGGFGGGFGGAAAPGFGGAAAPGFGGAAAPGVPGAAAGGMGAGVAPQALAPGFIPGVGGGGFGFGGRGAFPVFPPFPGTINFAQPWLDGHYPAYDLNDRSQYWQGYPPAR